MSCVSVCVSVKSHLTSGASVCPENSVVFSAGNRGFVGFSLKPLHSKVVALFVFLLRYCSGILRNFSTAELSKALKKANSRLNASWNTTQC